MKTLIFSLLALSPLTSFAGAYDCTMKTNGVVIASSTFDTHKDGRSKELFTAKGFRVMAIWSGGGINHEIAQPDALQVIAFQNDKVAAGKYAPWGERLVLPLDPISGQGFVNTYVDCRVRR